MKRTKRGNVDPNIFRKNPTMYGQQYLSWWATNRNKRLVGLNNGNSIQEWLDAYSSCFTPTKKEFGYVRSLL